MITYHVWYVGDDMMALTSFPGLSYILWFMFTIVHGSRSVVEDREDLGTLIMRMMSGGCEVDTVGGAVK